MSLFIFSLKIIQLLQSIFQCFKFVFNWKFWTWLTKAFYSCLARNYSRSLNVHKNPDSKGKGAHSKWDWSCRRDYESFRRDCQDKSIYSWLSLVEYIDPANLTKHLPPASCCHTQSRSYVNSLRRLSPMSDCLSYGHFVSECLMGVH